MAELSPDPDAFALLHPLVQKQLWKMGWPALRPLQERSIRQILTLPQDVILTAATAAGKTEAAFLPVLSKIANEPGGSVRALYVGPLKALINDQFARVEDLCKYLEMPVHRWHGDAAASAKAHVLAEPSGVLLITPESLESLLINQSRKLTSLFSGLRFIVVDEMHAFLDNERGLHLQSLLMRLRKIANPPPQSIGLSATIGDTAVAQRWLNINHPQTVTVLNDLAAPKETKFRLHAYRMDEKDADAAEKSMAADMAKHCTGGSNLIFANSKADVEVFAERCARLAEELKLPDAFLVHHGSLSAQTRQEAEAVLKSGRPATAFCSSTLEMGIDIGSVKMVGQIGAPSSVASLKQRLGRSGRRGNEPRILRMYLRCKTPPADADILDKLHLNLIQAVAVSDLLLSGWIEPPQAPACDLSTLTQQIISSIAQLSSATAEELYQSLCSAGAFRQIDAPLFARLLRALAIKDVIEQAATGELILGLKGEEIRKDRSFYAVFQSPQSYKVIAEGQAIGELSIVPGLNDQILLAGRRWQVISIDQARRELVVKSAIGGKRPLFLGDGSDVHPHIRQTMRDILFANDAKLYLDDTAAALLTEARNAVKKLEADNRLFAVDSRRTVWMTWSGSRIMQTLLAMLALRGIAARDRGVAMILQCDKMKAQKIISEISTIHFAALELAQQVQPRMRRKFDDLLPDDLLSEAISRDRLDLAGALNLCRETI